MRTVPLGRLRLVERCIHYEAGRMAGALPRRNWAIPLSSLLLVGELTAPINAAFKHGFVFVAGTPAAAYLAPMGNSDGVGPDAFFGELGRALGEPLLHRPIEAAGGTSTVLWPPSLAGRELVRFVTSPSGPALQSWFAPGYELEFAGWVQEALGVIRWAA